MASGISDLLRHGPFKWLHFTLSERRLQKANRGKELKLAFGCNVKQVEFGNNVFVGAGTSLENCRIGSHSYINSGARILNTEIGKFCSVGPGVKIVLGNHPVNMVSTHPAFYADNKPFKTYADAHYFEEYSRVIIGNDVWIGEDVMIPGGVRIGDGAVIMSRAVVTRDVEPYAIVGGVPARLVKWRFDEQTRELIRNSAWWNRSEDWLRLNFRKFHDPEEFIDFLRTQEK